MSNQCPYFYALFATPGGLAQCQSTKALCKKKLQEDLATQRVLNSQANYEAPSPVVNAHDAEMNSPVMYCEAMDEDSPQNSPIFAAAPLPDVDAVCPTHTIVEDVPDEGKWYDECPLEWRAGAQCSEEKGKTLFKTIQDDQTLTGCQVLGPFRDKEEWELAKWLIKNVGQNKAEEFLNLPIVGDRVKPSFTNKKEFLALIDSLPTTAAWNYIPIEVTGDVLDKDNKPRSENMELWFRDPMECVCELIGNIAFNGEMAYAPARVFADHEGKERVLNEMSTGDWWMEMQSCLPPGATIASIILLSNKTRLTQHRGDRSVWPVYLKIGNIGKDTRRQTSSHATILIGYLPTPKLDCFTDATQSLVKYRLFHYCMGLIMDSVGTAGTTGVEMVCADSYLHNVFPILAAYIADYPEQCLIACCMENRCPICKVPPKQHRDHSQHPPRDVLETLDLITRHEKGENTHKFAKKFKHELSLCPVCPFWAGLPHSDIFQSFTPNLLHQLHKGVFKDHLVKWCTEIIGVMEVDAHFKTMPTHPTLKAFSSGISHVSQWTGTEHREMEKVFLGLVAGSAEAQVVVAVAAVINFITLASCHSHPTLSLAALQKALNDFHANKEVFVELGARHQIRFNIPKYHSMEHYVSMIYMFGSANGYNTELPERLHIDYAKDAYRASNKWDYIIQMTVWLQRQEAIDHFTSYLGWCKKAHGLDPPTTIRKILPLPTAVDDENINAVRVKTAGPTSATVLQYKIAKKHPHALCGIPVTTIKSSTSSKATGFLQAVSAFLLAEGVRVTPREIDAFNLFSRITVTLPLIPEATRQKIKNVIRAIPPVPPSNRSTGSPAYQDFVLVQTNELNPAMAGTALEGLCIAQLRVLFTLPSHYGSTRDPLGYIEWFTLFGVIHPSSGLYEVHRSTRNHRPYAEIITPDRIACNCFLNPKSPCTMDRRWTSSNVGELCKVFFVGRHIDMHMFCLIRLNHTNTIS